MGVWNTPLRAKMRLDLLKEKYVNALKMRTKQLSNSEWRHLRT